MSKQSTQSEIESVLRSLRWKEDTLVTNDFGERVWLKPLLNEQESQIGITDCCEESDPCSRHKSMVV